MGLISGRHIFCLQKTTHDANLCWQSQLVSIVTKQCHICDVTTRHCDITIVDICSSEYFSSSIPNKISSRLNLTLLIEAGFVLCLHHHLSVLLYKQDIVCIPAMHYGDKLNKQLILFVSMFTWWHLWLLRLECMATSNFNRKHIYPYSCLSACDVLTFCDEMA